MFIINYCSCFCLQTILIFCHDWIMYLSIDSTSLSAAKASGKKTKIIIYTHRHTVHSKSIRLYFFLPKLMLHGQNPLGGRWHHPSCACVKLFMPVGHISLWLLCLEYSRRHVVDIHLILIFMQRWLNTSSRDVAPSFPGQKHAYLTGTQYSWICTVRLLSLFQFENHAI